VFRKGEDGCYRSTALVAPTWIEYGFGTRHSSVKLADRRLATLRQIHSDKSLVVSSLDGCAGEADALITDAPAQLVSVRTADCLPVLLFDVDRRVAAAVHAGWRGTARNIAERTVRRVRLDFGAKPESLRVLIGPGIGSCCYEVGPEVIEEFRGLFPDLPSGGRSAMLDLTEANRRQFLAAGVPEHNIFTGAPCTSCCPDDFYSYRRSPGEPGRMVSYIGIRP